MVQENAENSDAVATEATPKDTSNSTPETPVESTPASAEETPEAAPAEAEAPAEPEKAEVAAEETVEEVKEEASEAVEAKAEPQATEEPAPKKEVEPLPPPVGFTGEITGKVVQLSDLLAEDETAKAEAVDLSALYDETLTQVTEHDIVQGRVVSIGEKDVVIDIGFKSDGIVSKNEFDESPEPGTEIEVYLERIEDRHGQLVLSKRRATELRRWQKIEDAFENDKIIEGVINSRIKGGMVVDLLGTEAFLPGSQIDIRPVRDFDSYLNKRMEFKIVKLNPVNGNIVVSHKALIEKDLQEQKDVILATMEPGQVLEGTVKNITDFGVFIDLGGVDGLLHITDLSWGRVSHPSEMLELDAKLNVVVLDYDKERQRISLGLKQLMPHPWEKIGSSYFEGMEAEGKVVSITEYGAFVELEKGIEGLVHISEMSWTRHIKHPSEMVALGKVVPVKILKLDEEGRKISLGMKQLEPDPWSDLAARFPPGTIAKGTVRNLTTFGVFVELMPGVDGLVHISDLSWTKKIRHPGEVVKKGQELDVVVIDVDAENRRLSLGHKQVETNPWNQFAVAYAEGTDTPAKVARFAENGIIVELPLEVEAFVPTSHLKKSEGDIEAAYAVNDELQLRVIEFDLENKRVILSETAKDDEAARVEKNIEIREKRQAKTEERKAVAKYARQQSGAATLGELSDLAKLKSKMEKAEAEAGDEAEPEVAEAAVEEPAAAEPEATVEAEAPAEAEAVAEAEAETTSEEATEASGEEE